MSALDELNAVLKEIWREKREEWQEWLTQCPKDLEIGTRHSVYDIMECLKAFCKINGYEVSKEYPNTYMLPKEYPL